MYIILVFWSNKSLLQKYWNFIDFLFYILKNRRKKLFSFYKWLNLICRWVTYMVLLWTCGYVFLKESSSCFNFFFFFFKSSVISFWLIYWWRRFQGVGSWLLVGGAFGTLASQLLVSLDTQKEDSWTISIWKVERQTKALRLLGELMVFLSLTLWSVIWHIYPSAEHSR